MTSPSPTKIDIEPILIDVPIRNYKNDDSANLYYQMDDNEGNYSYYLSNLVDIDEKYNEYIDNVKGDLSLFQNVNSWMHSKLQP